MGHGSCILDDPKVFREMFNTHFHIPSPAVVYDTTAHLVLFDYLKLTFVNVFTYEASSEYEEPLFSFFEFYQVNFIDFGTENESFQDVPSRCRKFALCQQLYKTCFAHKAQDNLAK